jgi:hypothetical protein
MPNWRTASEHPDKDARHPQVLVLWRKPFFGSYVLEPDVGFFDDPEDYEDGAGRGWCRWFDAEPLDVVYWMPIESYDLPYDEVQREGDGEKLKRRRR